MELTIANLDELDKTAAQILSFNSHARIFAFYGDMGAGKTTLIKVLCTKLGVADNMSSPTYAIVNQYLGKKTVYHIDLYRLKAIKEALAIGIEEYLHSGNYCFIEWPEIIETILPEGTIKITITVSANGMRHLNIGTI